MPACVVYNARGYMVLVGVWCYMTVPTVRACVNTYCMIPPLCTAGSQCVRGCWSGNRSWCPC